jgi:hypothetical protein
MVMVTMVETLKSKFKVFKRVFKKIIWHDKSIQGMHIVYVKICI